MIAYTTIKIMAIIMTTRRPNDITSNENNKTPIKVALSGLTMIQQALLEFYFATQEGAQKYTEVLGKDAEAFITNFDEQGAIEAWENLYAREKKPTLIFSDCHKTVNNYLYFPRPITPSLLLYVL
jgi:DNA-binding ferritin-like protein (Dps family)